MKQILFALAMMLVSVEAVGAAEKRPNIVVIKTDDQAEWSLGCYGNKESKSPAIDNLAAQGARFQNAFVDLNMPGMDGDELAVRLREQEGGPPPVLVAVTARSDEESERRIR